MVEMEIEVRSSSLRQQRRVSSARYQSATAALARILRSLVVCSYRSLWSRLRNRAPIVVTFANRE